MQIRIDEIVLNTFPQTEIGYLIAEVEVRAKHPFVEELKSSLKNYLETQGINPTTFAVHPSIAVWRSIYEECFKVKAKSYRSSIEALVKRIVTGKELWNINCIVDLYNCCSIHSLLPMGGYDLNKISGDISIRFGKETETFLGLGEWIKTEVKPNHVVYADEKTILCWLWNHKDSQETCIDEKTKKVIFFVDAFDHEKNCNALKQLENCLEKIQCTTTEKGTLNRSFPEIYVRG